MPKGPTLRAISLRDWPKIYDLGIKVESNRDVHTVATIPLARPVSTIVVVLILVGQI